MRGVNFGFVLFFETRHSPISWFTVADFFSLEPHPAAMATAGLQLDFEPLVCIIFPLYTNTLREREGDVSRVWMERQNQAKGF